MGNKGSRDTYGSMEIFITCSTPFGDLDKKKEND